MRRTLQLRQASGGPGGTPGGVPRGLVGHHRPTPGAPLAVAVRPGGRVLPRGAGRRGAACLHRGARSDPGGGRPPGLPARVGRGAAVRRLPRRRPGVRAHERARARRLPGPRAAGHPPVPHRQDAPGPRPRGGGRGQPPRRARRPGLRGPGALGDPAAPAAAGAHRPGGGRSPGQPRAPVQARLLRRLARGRPTEAGPPGPPRLSPRHQRPRAPEDDRRRGLPQRPGVDGRRGPSGSCPSSTPAPGAGSG